MTRLSRPVKTLLSVAFATGLLWAVCGNAGETPRKLRIIYTNDTLGQIEPCG